MTTRKDLEGTLARWFAIDTDSHIAVFTGPYAAWPAAVFDDYPTVEAASELMAHAPPTTEAVLSPRWIASGASPTFPTLEATRGLYSFDCDPGYGGQTKYFLCATPARPLVASEAASVLSRAAGLVRLSTLRFALVTEVELAGLVPLAR